MNELEKRAKQHRKRQKGLSPFGGLKPDNVSCILANPGNETAMANFNKGTSLSTDSALSEDIQENNIFSIGDRVIFYEPNKGRQTWGIIKDFVHRDYPPKMYAVIKSATGRVYEISLKKLEDEMEFDLDEDYDEDARERSAHVNELKKYWKNFDGNIKGKRISNSQIDAIVNRLRSAEKENEIYNDPDFYERKVTTVIDDPNYNFEDPEREGEYQVEKMLEHLAEVESEAYKGALPECYDLQNLYEEVQERLTPSEKQELNKVLNSTNDPETIQNYLTALRAKNEDIDDVDFKCDINDSVDDEMTWSGYEADVPTDEEELNEDYIERKDDWGEPYDSAEIVKTIRDLTNNYTSQSGTLRTYYRVEKNAAMNELRNHYSVVEVSDGRRDAHDDINWVIAYADPIVEEDDTKNESLTESRLDPDNDMIGTRVYYAIKFDGDTVETIDVEDPDYAGDEFYVAVDKSKELLKDYDVDHVEIVYTVEDNFDKHEDVEYEYWTSEEEVEENLNEDYPNTIGDRYYRIDIKHVKDSDGFLTDYTWWYDAATDQHIFIFGDSEVYTPEDSSPDWETDSEDTAQEWWDNYVGPYEDDDLDEGLFNKLDAIESKVLGRNGVDALDEMSEEQLDKEIRAAKSLVKQAQNRNDEKSEKTFTDWLNVLERTKDGESFAVINDENKANVLRQIEGTIKTKGLNKEEAQKFVYNMVSNGICDQDTYNAVVTSDEFKQLMKKLFNEELQEDYSSEDVKAFLDEVGGYTDYDGKVEELMDYFGMTKDQAESAIQDYVTSPDDDDDFEENLNPINEDSIDDKPWNRLDSIHRILNVYDSANDKYQDHIVSEIARLAGFPDDSYVGSLDPDDYVWTKISDEKLRWLDNVTRLTDANRAKDEDEDDAYIEKLWDALYDVSGIQEIDHSANEAPDHYVIVFESRGDVDKRENEVTSALTAAGFNATCTAVNGSNVFEYHIPMDLVESYTGLNKDIVFIADACEFDEDTLETTDTIADVEVTMPELTEFYGENVMGIAMKGITRQAVQNAGGIPSNWEIGYLINNIASKKFHEAYPHKEFVMGPVIEVERMDLLPDGIKLLQRKLGDILLPKNEELEEAISDLSHPEQEFDSAATSINSSKLPAIYKMVNFNEGDVVIDFGGGRFDNAVEYIKDKGATLVVYDPYNRSAEHNEQVLATLEENGGADAAVNSNVLNVIKEPEARQAVLQNIKKLLKPGAPVYITVYEGRGDGVEGPTKSGYQLNRKTEGYLDEVREVFPDAIRKGKLIVATNR